MRTLHEAIRSTLAQPDVEKKLVDSGTEVFVSSPEEFARFIAGETRSWKRILTGISVEQQ